MLPWRILDLISMSFIKNTECNRCSILSREPLRRMCVQSEGWIIWSCTWNWLTWIDSRTEFEELCIVRSTTKCPLNKLIQTSPLPVTPSGPAKTVTISKVPLTVTTSFLVIRLVWGRKWCHCSYSVSLWPVLQVDTTQKARLREPSPRTEGAWRRYALNLVWWVCTMHAAWQSNGLTHWKWPYKCDGLIISGWLCHITFQDWQQYKWSISSQPNEGLRRKALS